MTGQHANPHQSYDSLQLRDEEEDRLYHEFCLAEMQDFLRNHKSSLDGYLALCEEQGFIPDYIGFGAVKDIRKQLEALQDRFKTTLDQPVSDLNAYTQRSTRLNQLYRAAVQLRVPAARLLSWCSTAYNTSTETAFFHRETFGGSGTEFNYDRSRSYRSLQLEQHFLKLLNFDPRHVAMLCTSSGMAAYQLVENYLLQEVLQEQDIVYSPRQNYGEIHNVMLRHKKSCFVQHMADDETTIVDFILTHRPKVVFLSSLYNDLNLYMLDIEDILKRLTASNYTHDLHIAIDDTLWAGTFDPFRYQSKNLHIYYYFSAIKNFQAGLDSGFAGGLAVNAQLHNSFRRLRGFMGAGLYDSEAWLYPLQSPEMYTWRMKRMTRNATMTAEILHAKTNLVITHPLLSSHPHRDFAAKQAYLNPIVTCHLAGANTPEQRQHMFQALQQKIDRAIDLAKDHGLSLIHSESFGYKDFRINAYNWSEHCLPYIRLSCGDRTYAETERMAGILAEAFSD